MAEKLTETQIAERLATLHGWTLEDGMIVRTFTLKDFTAALTFVGAVGYLAEAAGHHPDITINYNRVKLALTTHGSGGITEKDFALATQINALP
ncbi:MAG: 4a-hydroxytetrahydrobiopterin dehydratase [Candidatus Thermofonsia Clade 1 bacterium]|uniref:Putative pterin-4-alpha-carbinolamine dehydratase n=1 Tax=Candidatus Thermofonsia Clade 1 bacterium TaxID=2364210 RepID=A0A2M8P0W8_9CHLR|nr:MAG: 4a-hydroxytetrahydrobiopterin dehydratase [Candidatus Thermofonsia Clade 1 bacterium]